MMKMLTVIVSVFLIFVVSGFSDGTAGEYETWYRQGIARVKDGDLEGARQCFAMALVYDPNAAEPLKGLLLAEERLKRNPDLYRTRKENAAAGVSGTESLMGTRWHQKGINYLKRGDLKRANISFSKALEYDAANADAQQGYDLNERRLTELANMPAMERNRKYFRGHTFRLLLGSVPGAEKNSDGDVVTSTGGSWQAEIMYVKQNWRWNDSRLGWLIGGGAFLAYNAGQDQFSEDADAAGLGGTFYTGVCFRPVNNLVLELTPYIGGGIPQYWHMGGKGGVHFLFGKVGLGMEAGYSEFRSGSWHGDGAKVAFVASFNF
jgi:hypothetical protein